MKKVLVTGGAGFIGSNLIEKLISESFEVVCVDNLSTGKIENIEGFIGSPNFQFHEADILNIDLISELSKDVDAIFHQAALGSVPRSIEDPLTTNKVNIEGTLNIFKVAADNNVRRVIYAASSSTYGDSQSLPKIENEIGKPLSPYAVTKFVNELYADVFAKTYGLECIGLRYFNVFGKRQDPFGSYAAVIPLFIKNLINHVPITINGDGTYSRDFTYIDNVVQMNLRALETSQPDSVNQVYNTAYGQQTNLNKLVGYLKEFLSDFDPEIAKVKVIHGPIRTGDIPHSHANIDKAKQLLGYNPMFSIREGLKESISWYWKNLRKKVVKLLTIKFFRDTN